MKALILAATILSSPALAQHNGQAMPIPQQPSVSPHSGHTMLPPMASEAPAETQADMPMEHMMTAPELTETQADDPHAGHNMTLSAGDATATPNDPHADHDMQSMAEMPMPPASGPPPEAFSGPAHVADALFGAAQMAVAREQVRAEVGGLTTYGFFVDRLEAQIGDGPDTYLWDLNAWHGGDIDKLWIKSEGEGAFDGELEGTETQALWSHAIGPYFDFQTGVRYDIRPGPDRGHVVVGVQGLAPYFFELDVAAFLSDQGDLTAGIEAEYDQRITQRLILQPRAEVSLSAQDIPEIGIGSGLSSFEAGLRLRYEFVPEFAPYVGVEWQQKIGDTADFARTAGEDPGRVVFLTGVRIWF